MRALFLFLLLIPSFAPSQQNVKDSLENLLTHSKDDTVKINLLNTLGKEYWSSSIDKAMSYASEALNLAQKLDFKRGEENSFYVISVLYRKKGGYDSAIFYSNRSLQTAEGINDKQGMANSFSSLGAIYNSRGNYQRGLEYHLKSLKLREELKDKKGISVSLGNIGFIYLNLKKYKEALQYSKDCLKIMLEMNDEHGTALAYNNIGLIYFNLEDYNSAVAYYQQSIKINEKLGNTGVIAYALMNIGGIYSKQKNHPEALEYFFKSLELYKKMEDKNGTSLALTNIADIYEGDDNYKKAIYYFEKSLEISKAIDAKDRIADNYRGLSIVYSKMENYKNAYDYHKKYSEMKDSLLNEESSKQIAEMQTKYETEKKEQQITLLNKDKELQEAQLNRQKIIIWSVAGGLLVVLTLSIFIFRERRKSEKLLLNILPAETAKELKANGKATAKHYESVTVMFTDFKGFTTIAEKLSAEELVSELDFLFKKFDEIVSRYNIEKIKTIGDAYMCASGLPTPNSNHAEEIVKAGIEIQNWMINQNGKWQLRMGIHSGAVTAGVVGDKKFAYDIWGDTVNTASRMESSGEPGKINISGSTYELLKNSPLEGGQGGMSFIHRGKIPAKNKGEIEMYFVESNMQS